MIRICQLGVCSHRRQCKEELQCEHLLLHRRWQRGPSQVLVAQQLRHRNYGRPGVARVDDVALPSTRHLLDHTQRDATTTCQKRL